MQIYLISLATFPDNRSFGMGTTRYSCITPAQISRKRYYLRAKVSGCWLLFSINQCCYWVSLVNIRLLSLSTSDKLNASINKPNKARLPSLNPEQSEISPLNGEVVYVKSVM